MIHADFDSEANALDLELVRFEHYDDQEQVDDDFCTVGFAGGAPVDVELLDPADHLDLLEVVARRYDLDGTVLLAAAKAALAAPDRLVTMDLSESLVA
jgi:hypothetical protein